MKRRALLIGSPGLPGTKTYLEDMTKKDLNKIKSYLMSNTGGKWYEDEILLIDTNNINEVKKYIEHVRKENNDLVFCTFTGHGWYDGNKSTRVFEIGNSDLYESDLRGLSSKQISVFDSCAEVHRKESLMESTTFRNMLSMDSYDNKNYRRIYEEEVNKCHAQMISLYSSSIDEYSQTDNDIGGHFIHYLLKAGSSNQIKNLDTLDTFHIAKNEMKKDRRSQTPTSSFPKSAKFFLPFSLGRDA